MLFTENCSDSARIFLLSLWLVGPVSMDRAFSYKETGDKYSFVLYNLSD